MIYLLLNTDEYLATQRVAQLKRAVGEDDMADLNTTALNGPQTSAGELLGQAAMMPFLANRRLLIVRDYCTYLDRRMAASKSTDSAAHDEAAQLLTGLAELPTTNDVVLLEEKSVDKRRHLWKGFTAGAGQKIPGLDELIKRQVITVEEHGTPDAKALPSWIQQQAKRKGIAIDGRAVQMLATFVGPQLRQLDSELEKLAAYASGRAITPADVKLLVSDASEAVIWSLTDALSQRNGRLAMQSLYELRRNDANPFYLLTMIARQYRIMIKAKDAAAQGMGNEFDIAKQIKESPFPVKKALQQARNYTFAELDGIMESLLHADHAMKTGADPDTTIDVLIAELTIRPKSPAR